MNKAETRRLRKHSLVFGEVKGPRRDVIIHKQMPGVRVCLCCIFSPVFRVLK